MRKIKARFVKLKAAKFCILNDRLYWKDPSWMLLNHLLEDDAKRTITYFHKGGCGGHHYWKVTLNKILRVGFYWPTLFYDVYKGVISCHECQFFYGKKKLFPLSLKSILVEQPF